jgi:hypothetical protein
VPKPAKTWIARANDVRGWRSIRVESVALHCPAVTFSRWPLFRGDHLTVGMAKVEVQGARARSLSQWRTP